MPNPIANLLAQLEPEIEDAEEEAFFLFSQAIPSQNLGIIDSKAPALELSINGQDLTITQSPAVLSSNRAGGTTGAVVWKVTPLFASWLASPTTNPFFTTSLLTSTSTILELGCGVSALVGLTVGPLVGRYLLTDQPYVSRLVQQNLSQNQRQPPPSSSSSRKAAAKPLANNSNTITFHPLDWELDTPTRALAIPDVVLACDCIYNDALIPPFVQTCVEACRLRRMSEENEDEEQEQRPCVCVVAQQLRDPEILEAFLREFMAKGFRAWRVPDATLPEGLRSGDGFVVHVGILREAMDQH